MEEGVILKNLKKLRKKQGMKQSELAKRLKLTRSAVSNWENGITSPRANMLPALAKVLKCTINDFF